MICCSILPFGMKDFFTQFLSMLSENNAQIIVLPKAMLPFRDMLHPVVDQEVPGPLGSTWNNSGWPFQLQSCIWGGLRGLCWGWITAQLVPLPSHAFSILSQVLIHRELPNKYSALGLSIILGTLDFVL